MDEYCVSKETRGFLGKGVKSSSRYPDTWSNRYMYERHSLLQNIPLGYWNRPEDYIAMKEWDEDLLKEWAYNKWTPSNAELMVVGRVDPVEAERLSELTLILGNTEERWLSEYHH